jgi:hypothetical protein
MVKTDSAGSLQWSKRTGGPLSEILYKPWQDGSGNYYFAGSASTNTLSGNQDGWLLKVNSTGATNLVNYTYGTSIADRTYSLATLPGGSTLVLSGYAQSNSGFENALFLPVNSADGTLAGSALFAGTLTGNARAMSSFYSTTGLVQGGYIYTASEPLGSAYAVKYATTTSPCQVGIATLDILNQSTGFAYTDSTGSTEGIAAATQSPTTFTPAPVTPGQNIFCIVLDVSIPENENEFSIYPNPVHDVLNLEFPSYREARICITDVNGKKILEKEFQGTKAEISLEGFSPGVYLVVSDNGGVPVKKKFVKIN